MDLAALLTHTVLNRATVAAGAGALHAEVSWVHLVDHPDITGWIKPGHLLLTTGYHWPYSTDAQAQRALIQALQAAGLAGVILAVPRFLDHFPVDAIDEANRVGLALLELPWDVPFSQVTEEVHARIIGNQHAMLVRSEAIHRALTNAAARQASLTELAGVLSELLDRDVTFTAPDGALLGARDTSALRQSIPAPCANRVRGYTCCTAAIAFPRRPLPRNSPCAFPRINAICPRGWHARSMWPSN